MSEGQNKLTNIPKGIRAGKLSASEPNYSNLPNTHGEVSWKQHQYKTCSEASVTEMGPKPSNLMGAVTWIEQYWQKVGEGYDECKNVPVPDLSPPPPSESGYEEDWGGMIME